LPKTQILKLSALKLLSEEIHEVREGKGDLAPWKWSALERVHPLLVVA